MAERSRDRSSSTESQPKFPECSHFRRRNDNHRRCQQCRLNDGLPLCTQDSPCLVCQDWLPEAWTAQAKATAQRNRRKAAAAAKAARKETEMMDDSVELHAPGHAFPTKRPKSEESSKTKRSKTVASSSQPKSVASSVSAAERPSSHGSGHRRSRTPERKRRHGESPRHQSSRRDGHSSDRREGERDQPSSSGGSSSRRRAESGSVSKASDTRPSSSSSRHHRERRRESSDRTGGTFVVRREFQLSPPKSKAPEKRRNHSGCLSSSTDSYWIGPSSSSPGPGSGRLSRCGPGSERRLDHEWRAGSTQRHGHRQRPDYRSRIGHRQRPGHRGQTSHRGRLGNRGRLDHRWRPCHSGRPDHICGYRQHSRCLDGGVITQFTVTFWWPGRFRWSSTSSSSGSGRIGKAGESGSHASGWSRHFLPDGDQYSTSLPFHPQDHQSGNTGGFYVDVDVASTPHGTA